MDLAVAQLAAYRQAVQARQHQVQHHQIEGIAAKDFKSLDTVCGDGRVALKILEVDPDQPGDVRVVLDDQHLAFHGPAIICPCEYSSTQPAQLNPLAYSLPRRVVTGTGRGRFPSRHIGTLVYAGDHHLGHRVGPIVYTQL